MVQLVILALAPGGQVPFRQGGAPTPAAFSELARREPEFNKNEKAFFKFFLNFGGF
jgi:hypothetical protein